MTTTAKLPTISWRNARGALLMLVAVALTACNTPLGDSIARDAARQAVRPVLAERFPGVPLEPAVDCVINNASSNELLSLAADAVTGPTASTVQIVTNITSRPETIQCLVAEGLPALLR